MTHPDNSYKLVLTICLPFYLLTRRNISQICFLHDKNMQCPIHTCLYFYLTFCLILLTSWSSYGRHKINSQSDKSNKFFWLLLVLLRASIIYKDPTFSIINYFIMDETLPIYSAKEHNVKVTYNKKLIIITI